MSTINLPKPIKTNLNNYILIAIFFGFLVAGILTYPSETTPTSHRPTPRELKIRAQKEKEEAEKKARIAETEARAYELLEEVEKIKEEKNSDENPNQSNKEVTGPTIKTMSAQVEKTGQETTPKPGNDQPTHSPVSQPEPSSTSAPTIQSRYLTRWFGNRTGQMHWDICTSKEIGRKFVQAFAEFGPDIQVLACVTLNHENGVVGADYITDAVSPCWSTNTQEAKARKCSYASDNTAGVDAGLFMINTFYQRHRIAKLGGPSCEMIDSRNPKDPCNMQKIAWLHNMDNQIKIVLDIYRQQGFHPWVAYNKHVAPYI
jgi:hypothetical protein